MGGWTYGVGDIRPYASVEPQPTMAVGTHHEDAEGLGGEGRRTTRKTHLQDQRDTNLAS